MVVKGVNLKKCRIFFIIKTAKDNGYGERKKIKRERKKKWEKEKSNADVIMDNILILMDTVEPQFKIEIKTWICSMADKG